ncbi:MAG: S-methyl-5-thioribose-1-phosphate isomerase [Candidatus Lokiarchaeota archaeon]|nr:S-methyl-5-thioribose-1-phosphate isomerase [Candidatus Lokiarchaeota archaeon]MBD3199225.1 S-methyl-5-thioribose-1-phosphate isomerase [Candidatus Lokiarchaeota archaeon]
MIPSIEWVDEENKVKMIDQTLLPHELKFLEFEDYREVANSITVMNIRGAPAIGAAASMAMALATLEYKDLSKDEFLEKMNEAANHMRKARPTASNLFWAVNRMMKIIENSNGSPSEISEEIVEEAKLVAQEDVNVNKSIGKHGAEILADGDTVLTHCNAGSLATVQYGTALAPVRAAIEQRKKISVVADETRPRLQGARLTAYECQYDKIPVKVCADNSSGLLMKLGKIDKVIVGTDRVSSDAVFNKIGTYLVALAAKDNNIPFYVACPRSTLSLKDTIDDVEIEQRDSGEVSKILGKVQVTPEGVECLNYAFDITPFRLVTGIITEDGVFTPEEMLKKYKE